jgi:hypothetical protein
LIIIHSSIKNSEGNKITKRFIDHLATTTNTGADQRRAALLAAPSMELDIA